MVLPDVKIEREVRGEWLAKGLGTRDPRRCLAQLSRSSGNLAYSSYLPHAVVTVTAEGEFEVWWASVREVAAERWMWKQVWPGLS